jgi:hypothetical protein
MSFVIQKNRQASAVAWKSGSYLLVHEAPVGGALAESRLYLTIENNFFLRPRETAKAEDQYSYTHNDKFSHLSPISFTQRS